MYAGQSTGLKKSTDNHLIVEQLSCVRGDRMLFRDLDFRLEPGQAGLLTGLNGVGKSSLLRLISGLLEPFSGTVTAPESKSLCDDKLPLDEHLALGKALQFWANLDHKATADVSASMEKAGLDHLAEVPLRYFSTGQRQRARLAHTYLTDANLWLLDEPANGLDTTSAAQLGETLQVHLDSGGIILAASHILLPIEFSLTLDLKPSLEAA